MLSGQTVLFALLGGILPALLWLWFWLNEDRKNPEPRGLILLAFLGGMLMVPLVIPFESMLESYFVAGTAVIISWSIIEELFKYIAAYVIVLRRPEVNEPIDAVIYMITVALGFAALENTLFLLTPLSDSFFAESILTGNFRFLGATLLHTLSSAVVGFALAFSFYKHKNIKFAYVALGLVLAIVLHALFNFFIITSDGERLLTVFSFVWIGIVILLILFEKIKHGNRNPASLIRKRK